MRGRNAVGNADRGSRITRRNAPALTCLACGQVIPRDVVVVKVAIWSIEPYQIMGHTYEYHTRLGAGVLCAPCWDTAQPDPKTPGGAQARDALWRRVGGQQWRLVPRLAKFGVSADEGPCAWCGRKVLQQVIQGRFLSCSKRCQVYHSQDRHGAAWAKWRPELPARPCDRCRVEFQPRSTDHHDCSGACRQAAYRKRVARRAELQQRARVRQKRRRVFSIA